MIKLASFLFVIGLAVTLSVGILAQDAPASLGIRVFENNEAASELDVQPGEIIELKIYAENAIEMAAISGTLILPETDFTVVGIEQLFGICSAWDSKPVLSANTIEFACAQGPIAASSGVMFSVKAVVNSNFSSADIKFKDELYLTTDNQFNSPTSRPLKLRSAIVVETAGGVGAESGSNSVMVLLVNFVLIAGVILSLVMGYKYYRVNRQYAN